MRSVGPSIFNITPTKFTLNQIYVAKKCALIMRKDAHHPTHRKINHSGKNAFLLSSVACCKAAIPGLRAGDESFGQLTSQRPKLRRSRVFDKVSALAAVTKQEAMLETSRCVF